MISIEQIKAARALLDWTQEDLAKAAGLSKPMINTLERRLANPKVDTLNSIQKALESAGIEFTEGPGIKLQSMVLKTQVFEGSDAVVRLLNDIVDTLKGTGQKVMISGVDERIYREIGGPRVVDGIKQRFKHGIRAMILSCEGDTDFLDPIEDYRWMKKEYFSTTPFYVYDNKYAIILWGPPQKVVLIENNEIAECYRKQFLAHWAVAKPAGVKTR
jgi:transcriptional regulator with XRE-family HTH domain